MNTTNRRELETSIFLGNERLSDLQLIKYEEKVDESNIKEILSSFESTSYVESFPLFIDETGKVIDFNKPIGLFNGVKLISQFLEKRFGEDKNFISEVKISELLELFKDNKNVTVLELYNHVGRLYNKDKNSFVKDLIDDSDKISMSDNTVNLNSFKSLGLYWDITLNEIAEGLLNLNWNIVLDYKKLTLNAAPFTINLISYSLLLKKYMKYVHNRPYSMIPNSISLEMQKSIRRRNLFIFSLFGGPLALYALSTSLIIIKNTIDINLFVGSENNIINKKESSSFFLLLLSKINNKIPTRVKVLFNFILFSIVVLKLLGYSLIDVFIDLSLLKNIVYISFLLTMSYQLLNLYIIHKFSTRKVNISEVWPDFFINWLKEFEVMASTKESIKEFKKICYIEISIYIGLMVIFIIIFN
uniref:Uncharacterized protein n=1 Tax=Phallus echinovolvatus TaxID=2201239 RepID=A0A7D5KG97_9AGAM|nr:hypothetical protein [Phallus echinovolvatus]QLD96646.1 hypothetical protein [Phallus echinovolvatus]